MIQVRGLTKRYGATTAVDGLGFDVRPAVTGFIGRVRRDTAGGLRPSSVTRPRPAAAHSEGPADPDRYFVRWPGRRGVLSR